MEGGGRNRVLNYQICETKLIHVRVTNMPQIKDYRVLATNHSRLMPNVDIAFRAGSGIFPLFSSSFDMEGGDEGRDGLG